MSAGFFSSYLSGSGIEEHSIAQTKLWEEIRLGKWWMLCYNPWAKWTRDQGLLGHLGASNADLVSFTGLSAPLAGAVMSSFLEPQCTEQCMMSDCRHSVNPCRMNEWVSEGMDGWMSITERSKRIKTTRRLVAWVANSLALRDFCPFSFLLDDARPSEGGFYLPPHHFPSMTPHLNLGVLLRMGVGVTINSQGGQKKIK